MRPAAAGSGLQECGILVNVVTLYLKIVTFPGKKTAGNELVV